MARKSTSVQSGTIKEVVSDIKIEKTLEQPIEDRETTVVEVPPIKENKSDKKSSVFTTEEKEYILKQISLGYHYKDVIKRAKVYLKLTEEKYDILSHKVRRVEDIFTNLGV